MSDFSYTYKTSDGIRREGVISASSRDDAFASLRAKGIRPIRVLDNNHGDNIDHKRKWVKIVAALIILFTVGITSFWFGRIKHIDRTLGINLNINSDKKYAIALDSLKERAEASKNLHNVEMRALGLEMFHDYNLIHKTKDFNSFNQAYIKASKSIDDARRRTRELFSGVYTTFPAECTKERFVAQKLYGEIMNEIDTNEERLIADNEILTLLNYRRSDWYVENGRIIFTDKSLEKEFEYLRSDTDPAAIRWRRDFGCTPKNSPSLKN